MGKHLHTKQKDEQKALMEQIWQAASQLKAASNFFSEARSVSEVDQAIYQIKALEVQYSRLLNAAKEQSLVGEDSVCHDELWRAGNEYDGIQPL